TLTINNLPVIFISESFLKTNLNTDEIEYAVVGGMGKSKCVKGEIIFKEEKKDVYYAFSNRRFFNGCDCLLNVYLSN
ncbi:TPA: hypothetical protein GXZ34_04255, partial [bacterium]|nr:hypothetical protein [bacterium]